MRMFVLYAGDLEDHPIVNISELKNIEILGYYQKFAHALEHASNVVDKTPAVAIQDYLFQGGEPFLINKGTGQNILYFVDGFDNGGGGGSGGSGNTGGGSGGGSIIDTMKLIKQTTVSGSNATIDLILETDGDNPFIFNTSNNTYIWET